MRRPNEEHAADQHQNSDRACGHELSLILANSPVKANRQGPPAGLVRAADLFALRVEGPNKPGDCQRITRLLADAGLSLRGLSATVCGSRYVLSLGFDTEADAPRAASLLKAAAGKKK